MAGDFTHSYRFKSYRLDLEERQLLSNDAPVPLTPKAFDVLATLVERSGHLVEKDELLNKVWAGSFVEEANVARIVHTLRKVLGEDDNGNKFIETVAKKGYRFVAKVETFNGPSDQFSFLTSERSTTADVLPELILLEKGSDRGPPLTTAVTPPETTTRPARVVLFSVGFLTAISLILVLSFNFRNGSASPGSSVRTFAVLPVKPIAESVRDPIYEMGLAESFILKLSSMKGFVVRPLSATRKYADVEQDALAAGLEQKVDYVLASSYQLADGRIRVTAQLFDVATGRIEETYKSESDAANLFAMQDAIAGNVGILLQKRFVTTSSSPKDVRGTDNEQAYRLFIQGMAVANRRKHPDGRQAIEYFEQAVRLDPNFALAYAELASAYSSAFNGGGRNATDAYLKAKAAIEKALAIDETLAEAHSYLGIIKTNYEWDFAGAELEHKRAVELNPNSSSAHGMYARLLAILGKFDESIAEMKTAIDLEPASAGNHHSYGWILFQAHRYDEAIAEEELVLKMDPNLRMAYNVLRNSYSQKGDNDKSFEAFLQMGILDGDGPDEIDSLKSIYARSGWRGVFERQLQDEKASEKGGNPDYAQLAGTSIELGQREEALGYLEKAIDQNRFTLITLKVNPRYDPLRGYPRFDALVRRVGLN